MAAIGNVEWERDRPVRKSEKDRPVRKSEKEGGREHGHKLEKTSKFYKIEKTRKVEREGRDTVHKPEKMIVDDEALCKLEGVEGEREMTSSSVEFGARVINDYRKTGQLRPAEQIVRTTVNYFKNKYDQHRQSGRERKTCGLSTAQNTLSKIKTLFEEEFEVRGIRDSDYLKQLRLQKSDMDALNASKSLKVHDAGTNIVAVPGDLLIRKSRDTLVNVDASRALLVAAVACLTGRRMVEIIHRIQFNPPEEAHAEHEQYWCNISGLAKQRGVLTRFEVPLLEKRDAINKAMTKIRTLFPSPPTNICRAPRVDLSVGQRLYFERKRDVAENKWVSSKYGKEMSRMMKAFCPEIGSLHKFRRFYVGVCLHYFPQDGVAENRTASDYLGHRQMSGAVLTYKNYIVRDLGTLDYQSI